MTPFHDVLFPIELSIVSRGGPQRATEIVVLGSGREERNARWEHARRRYDAGTGLRSLALLSRVTAFFEERRGRLYGFRWRDGADDRSGAPGVDPTPTDQLLGIGDGTRSAFGLVKTYGGAFAPYRRPITRPVQASLRVAVAGVEQAADRWSFDAATRGIVFASTAVPPAGAEVRAGFIFDVPVRFDTDHLDIDLAALAQGRIPHIPVIEILE
jgi:uncharacterized protein (TIGR02217 family)